MNRLSFLALLVSVLSLEGCNQQSIASMTVTGSDYLANINFSEFSQPSGGALTMQFDSVDGDTMTISMSTAMLSPNTTYQLGGSNTLHSTFTIMSNGQPVVENIDATDGDLNVQNFASSSGVVKVFAATFHVNIDPGVAAAGTINYSSP